MEPNYSQHQKVWKVGSRWSHDGNAGSCILELFRAHRVAFVGWGYDIFAEIRKGDLVAISSGLKIVAIGTALEDAQPFTELGITLSPEEETRVHAEDISQGCRIDFQDLEPNEFVPCARRAVHRVNNEQDRLRDLALKLQEAKEGGQFAIKARSCTLLASTTTGHESLLSPEKNYRIPVYQRPYSWGEPEVRRLLGDLFTAFFGRLGRVKKEPIFIGTLQITAGQPLDENLQSIRHEIIDGQQRLTTLNLLLHALQLCSPKLEPPSDWLATEVGGGIQQTSFQEALTASARPDDTNKDNRYLANLNLIIDALNDEFRDDEGLINSEAIGDFYHYLVSGVWFVVIETRAGLSKTLQIFDSINTSGMDLNGTDVFKIRYFEYLREKENSSPNRLEDKELFESVAGLYTDVDSYNQNRSKGRIDIESILNSAKWLVATRLDLSITAKEFAGTTFFERFFDTVLTVQSWENFNYEKCEKILPSKGGAGLPVELFSEMRMAQSRWEGSWPQLQPEAMAMSHLMWWSRYSNYCTALVTLFIWKLKPSDKELAEFITATGKLMVILSVIYQQITSGRRQVAHELFEQICQEHSSPDSIQKHIQDLCESHRNDLQKCLMDQWIAHIPKSKTLLCRVVALLDELEADKLAAKDLCDLLFNSTKMEIDIEHIESVNHQDVSQRQSTWDEWGQDLHGLGNLTVLERALNLKIKNGDYLGVKKNVYGSSQFATVRKIAQEDSPWSLERAQERKLSLTETLTAYLCGPTPPTTTSNPGPTPT